MSELLSALAAVAAGERVLLADVHLDQGLCELLLVALSGPENVLGGATEPRWARLPLLACASTSGGRCDAAVPLAVAVELQAAAYSLLDALEDGDAWALIRQAGPRRSCNVATALLALAQRALLEVPRLAAVVMTDGWLGACVGQHRDLTLDPEAAGALEATLLAAEGKTVGVVAAALEAGALAGGADSVLAARYRRFGHAVGLAGQLANDLVGLTPGVDGATDVSRGQCALPIAFALESGAAAVRACLLTVRAGGTPDPALHARALAELENLGAYRYGWLLLAQAHREAAGALAEIEACRPVRGILDRLMPPRSLYPRQTA